MPPKKATTTTNGDASDGAGSGKFTWEGPNDTKLLLLTQGRYVKPEEYETLSTAFPGTTKGSIRNRISLLRVKQRDLYEELGWKLPEGGAGQSAKKRKKEGAAGAGAAGRKKRGLEEVDGDGDSAGGDETPCKKRGGKKGRKDEGMKREADMEAEMGAERIKEEEEEGEENESF